MPPFDLPVFIVSNEKALHIHAELVCRMNPLVGRYTSPPFFGSNKP
jgi:hypothetical protein